MKRIAVFLLLVIVVVAGACKKEKQQSSELQMSATVNTLPWRSYSSTVTIDKGNGLHLDIQADSTNSRIKLHLDNYHGAGTYTITDTSNTATYFNYGNVAGNQSNAASSGKIIITSNLQSSNTQTTIKGTFNFSSGTIQVTNGIFEVKLNLD